MSFLELSGIQPRPTGLSVPGFERGDLYLGQGDMSLEIVVFGSADQQAGLKTGDAELRKAYIERKGDRPAPVLIVRVNGPGDVRICGVGEEKPEVISIRGILQAQRMCMQALRMPTRHKANRYIATAFGSMESKTPGIENRGLLTNHTLANRVRDFGEWKPAAKKARDILALKEEDRTGPELIKRLGFESIRLDNMTDMLSSGKEQTAIAVHLKANEAHEGRESRFDGISPVSYAIAKADSERLPWVVMTRGESVRLYSTKNEGVGRRGRTESFVDCQTSLLAEEDEGLLWLLFSAEALMTGGTIYAVLEKSRRFAADMAKQLRTRIYNTVVPELAMGVCHAQNNKKPSREDLADTYKMALTVLFRLLFIAYAEDRDLLPYKTNKHYQKRSLTKTAEELLDLVNEGKTPDSGDNYWRETQTLFKAVSEGQDNWQVPAYNGEMFSAKESSPIGCALEKIKIPNRFFAKALKALLLVEVDDVGLGPVDFRSMSVREFGTIYEGLLESELSLAEQNLHCDQSGSYRPATGKDAVDVKAGKIYLHNRSGERKATGSYYTPEVLVEDLLDSTLEPAIDRHLASLNSLGDADRAEQFFKFRVADIAMGSGHFLVLAIDRIEKAFSKWLQDNRVPGVDDELGELRRAAESCLRGKSQNGQGDEPLDGISIEDGQLLRRMIARRCIYGVDINPLAVQLTRLSVWIHTFVPGLPLSFLDRNLIHGNSLIGIASFDEIKEVFDKASEDEALFSIDAEKLLGKAREPLDKLLRSADLSVEEIEADAVNQAEIKNATRETEALCDLIIAQPVLEKTARDKLKQVKKDIKAAGTKLEKPKWLTIALKDAKEELKLTTELIDIDLLEWDEDRVSLSESKKHNRAKGLLEPLDAIHFPIAFPEVFLDDKQGFDVILGNPPWEKPMVMKDKFWARHYPGLAALSPREQKLRIQSLENDRPDLRGMLDEEIERARKLRLFLNSGNFPGMGMGHPDFHKAFSWRFWHLVGSGRGRIGVVMPRSLLIAQGSELFRKKLFSESSSVIVTTLVNSGRWIFDIDVRYTVCLLSIAMNTEDGDKGLKLRGTFSSENELANAAPGDCAKLSFKEILKWSAAALVPVLPKPASVVVYRQLGKSVRFGGDDETDSCARPQYELNATNQKNLMDLENKDCPKGYWKIYKGASFNLWNPDTRDYNAWGNPDKILPWLFSKRRKSYRGAGSPFGAFSKQYIEDKSTLEAHRLRLAFRDVCRATDTRTALVALIPPETFITDKGPVLLFPKGNPTDEAYLLGLMCSVPFDWYARRLVETNLAFFVLDSIPVPRPKASDLLRKRVVKLAGRLACPDERYADWAKEVGVEYGPVDPQGKLEMIFELDAVVAHLYGLSEDQIIHIFETFRDKNTRQPKGIDPAVRVDEARCAKVIEYYRQWAAKPTSPGKSQSTH